MNEREQYHFLIDNLLTLNAQLTAIARDQADAVQTLTDAVALGESPSLDSVLRLASEALARKATVDKLDALAAKFRVAFEQQRAAKP